MLQTSLDINFDTRDIVTDPAPTYTKIREAGRVVRNSHIGGVVMIPGYEDVLAVLHEPNRYSNAAYGMGSDLDIMDGARILINTDPPEQVQLRKVVQQAFLRSSLVKLEGTISRVVDDLLSSPSMRDVLAEGGEVELMSSFCRPVPAQVIALLLGVPLSDLPMFIEWSEDLSALMDSGQRGGDEWPERLKRGEIAGIGLRAYLQEQIDHHRRHEQDDLINDLLVANEHGILNDKDILATCILLLIAGNETTTKLIGTSLRLLATYPDDRRKLVEDPEGLPTAIEEVLRYEGVTTIVPRVVTEDSSIAGTDLPAGEFLILLLGAANRDPDAFVEVDRFDIERTPNHHLAFAHGIHHCLGNRLARMEAGIAIRALLDRYPNYEMGDWSYRPVFLTRGLEQLQISAA